MADKLIYFSYVVNLNIQQNGGARDMKINLKSSIQNGDTVNVVALSFLSHTRTQVDVPYYFFDDSEKLTEYSPFLYIFV